jgi:hypothetical protein
MYAVRLEQLRDDMERVRQLLKRVKRRESMRKMQLDYAHECFLQVLFLFVKQSYLRPTYFPIFYFT